MVSNRSSGTDDTDEEYRIDIMTWKQWLNNALKRTHGLFGEALEYSFLNQDHRRAFLRVSFMDRDMFSTAINTYISSEELTGVPTVVKVEQETSNLKLLKVTDGDMIWYRRALEDEREDAIPNENF